MILTSASINRLSKPSHLHLRHHTVVLLAVKGTVFRDIVFFTEQLFKSLLLTKPLTVLLVNFAKFTLKVNKVSFALLLKHPIICQILPEAASTSLNRIGIQDLENQRSKSHQEPCDQVAKSQLKTIRRKLLKVVHSSGFESRSCCYRNSKIAEKASGKNRPKKIRKRFHRKSFKINFYISHGMHTFRNHKLSCPTEPLTEFYRMLTIGQTVLNYQRLFLNLFISLHFLFFLLSRTQWTRLERGRLKKFAPMFM